MKKEKTGHFVYMPVSYDDVFFIAAFQNGHAVYINKSGNFINNLSELKKTDGFKTIEQAQKYADNL